MLVCDSTQSGSRPQLGVLRLVADDDEHGARYSAALQQLNSNRPAPTLAAPVPLTSQLPNG